MFRKPRTSKERTNRVPERDQHTPSRVTRHDEDYVNVSYPRKNASASPPEVIRIPPRQSRSPITSSEGTEKANDILKYNRLKLQHGQGNDLRTKREFYAQHSDTDSLSSASGINEMGSSQGDIEHYNRLKININRLPDNRKLFQRVKILNPHLSTRSKSSSAINSSSAIQKREQFHSQSEIDSMTAAVKEKSHRATHTAKYRKEGYMHQLHSVASLQSLHTPTEFGSISKARSAEDILRASGNEVHSTKRRTPLTTASFLSPNTASAESVLSPSPTVNVLVTNESVDGTRNGFIPRQDNLSREWGVSSSNSNHLSARSVSNHSNSVSPSTSLSSVSDDSPDDFHCEGDDLTFISKMLTFTCTHTGKEVSSAAYEFSIHIPKGAVKRRKPIEFQVGVCLDGPFSLPRGYKLVSPIIMVNSRAQLTVRKPIEIVLSHCIDLFKVEQANKTVSFFRARMRGRDHKSKDTDIYTFKQTDMNNCQMNSNHGKLTTTELGFFCIMAKETTELRNSIKYCLLPVVPKYVDSTSWTVHYCIIYSLKAFTTVVQDQFGPSWETLTPKKFQLRTRIGVQNQQKIEINFQKIPESGWSLSLESESKIHVSDIDSWNKRWKRESHRQADPPQFVLRTHGEHATSSSVAQVWFTGPGMPHDLKTEVALLLKSTPTSSLVESPNQRSPSSLSSTSIELSIACGNLVHNDSSNYDHLHYRSYDHLPSREELDQTHIQLTYHNGHIDLPTDDELHAVASEVSQAVERDWIKLQVPLEIPDYILHDILNQRTVQQQVYRLLKEWRQHARDSSKEKLAKCLRNTDMRLHAAAALLSMK